MKFPFNALITAVLIAAISVISIISCTKDNTKSTTIIKCVTCDNGGLCINDTCRCPAGYEGVTCQTLSRNKYIGSWVVQERGTRTSFSQYTLNINSAFGVANVTIYGLYDYYPYYGTSFTGDINGDSIFIPSQRFNTGGGIDSDVIVGKGYFTPGTSGQFPVITVRYMVTNTYTGAINDFGYNNPIDSPSVWNFN